MTEVADLNNLKHSCHHNAGEEDHLSQFLGCLVQRKQFQWLEKKDTEQDKVRLSRTSSSTAATSGSIPALNILQQSWHNNIEEEDALLQSLG